MFKSVLFQRGGLDKRLLGVGVIWAKDSLVPGLSQHQGVFCPDHPNTKESFGQITPQNFKGHFPKIKKNTKESFVQITVDLLCQMHPAVYVKIVQASFFRLPSVASNQIFRWTNLRSCFLKAVTKTQRSDRSE